MNWPIDCRNRNVQPVEMIGDELERPSRRVIRPWRLPRVPKLVWSPYPLVGNGSKATEAIHGGQPNAAPITSHSLKKTTSYSSMSTPTRPYDDNCSKPLLCHNAAM